VAELGQNCGRTLAERRQKGHRSRELCLRVHFAARRIAFCLVRLRALLLRLLLLLPAASACWTGARPQPHRHRTPARAQHARATLVVINAP